MRLNRLGARMLIVLTTASLASAAEVWTSTFDSDADGVVDIFDNNSGKVMIGPVSSGRLEIEVWDNMTDPYTPDKAGRPLGVGEGSTDSFSGLYRFNWSTLNQDETQAYEAVGFLGSSASPQTRQIVGAVLRHWKVAATGDYYVAVDIGFGSVGNTAFGYQAGSSTYLGTSPTANDYKLAIGYDGPTTTLTVTLYTAMGVAIASNSANITALTDSSEVSAMSVDHLGWSDYYSGGASDRATVWQVDSLSYYDTADEAFDVASGTSGEWEATFDSDADGVVDIFDNNSGKVMIGPVTSGRLQIEAWDNTTSAYTPDKAGHPLGGILAPSHSFSGLYRFNWSTLNQDQTQAYEAVGFLGSTASPQTRQIVGALLRHWKAGSDYYVAVDIGFGSVGHTGFGYQAGATTWLGTNPTANDYQLGIGYDGPTTTLTVKLYDAIGTVLSSNSADLTTLTSALEVGAMSVDYLGWSDYTGNGGDRATIWQVDSLAYFETADGAFEAAGEFSGDWWRATFDVDGEFDGFVDVYDGPAKTLLNSNGAQGGELGVHQIDDWVWGSPYVPDKSGRSISVLDETSSWSALYEFRWTGLPTLESPQTYQFTGAFGGAIPQTRQVVGALIMHWKVVNDYYVNIGLMMGGSGDQEIDQTGGAINLGPDAEITDYQLAIGWDTDTDTLSAQLFLADGTPLSSNGIPMSMQVAVPTSYVTDYQVSYLGWVDYTGDENQITTVDWAVDTVTFWLDDPTAAFDEAVGAGGGACCLPDLSCADSQPESVCTAAGGIWQGAGTTCATTTCPDTGACCWPDDLSCSETFEATCDWLWQGLGTTCDVDGCPPAWVDPNAGEPWDVVFDGVDSAADNVPNHLRWDSAIDDDWDDPGLSFWLNTPTSGYMTVDRVTNPDDHLKTGNIWIRDPILTHAAGFTLEARVWIRPNSDTNAYSVTYLDDGGSFGVHLSPNQIKAGALTQYGSGNTVAFDTTDGFHLYRVVKQAGSRAISVYVDNSPTPILVGTGTPDYAAGSSAWLAYPRVLIGDNSNDPIYNANYVMDLYRYRRGADPPGSPPTVSPERVLPPLPPPASPGETWTMGYDGVGEPSASGWLQAGGSSWHQQPDGIMELDTLASPANARMDSPTGWTNRQAVTVEARIKVLPDSEDGGFNLVAADQLGSTSLVLSPDKAELMHSHMAVGRAAFAMDTTDDFHVYRFTRDAIGLYWHLYIDDNPVAAVADQHAYGMLLSYSRFWFGDVAFPVPDNGCHVLIDYIRWYEAFTGPVRYPDLDVDGDVDLLDFAEFQVCSGGSGSGECTATDFDGDDDVDLTDFTTLEACLSGPDVTPPAGCTR